MTRKLLLLSLLACAVSSAFCQGHNSNQPAAKLKDIGFILGHWKGKQNFRMDGGQIMAADINSRVTEEIGDRFIQEKTTTTLPGGRKGYAIHMIGYDAKSDMYKVWWFNDTSTEPQMLEGSFDGTKLVMNTPDGARGPVFKATYTKNDRSWSYRLEMKQGDAWRTLFVTDYGK